MATGVLVVGVQRATRLLGHLTLTEKAYRATVRLGVTTTSDDADGEVVSTTPAAALAEADVRAALAAQVGEIDQVPSAVSAIKVDGRRAYDRVRAGEQVELAARRVTVHALEVGVPRPAGEALDVDIDVRCSSGTYIRAIARDAGAALGVGGHLTALRRTAVGPFGLDVARTLDELGERFEVVSMGAVARAAFPVVEVDDEAAASVRHGRAQAIHVDGLTALLDGRDDLLALVEPRDGLARPVAVFA